MTITDQVSDLAGQAAVAEHTDAEAIRATYCELLARQNEPRSGDGELLVAVCEKIGTTVEQFTKDSAVVASTRREMENAARQTADEKTLKSLKGAEP